MHNQFDPQRTDSGYDRSLRIAWGASDLL